MAMAKMKLRSYAGMTRIRFKGSAHGHLSASKDTPLGWPIYAQFSPPGQGQAGESHKGPGDRQAGGFHQAKAVLNGIIVSNQVQDITSYKAF